MKLAPACRGKEMANRVNSHGPLSKVIRAPSSTRLDANGRDLSESADSEVAYLPCRKPRGSVLQAGQLCIE